MTNREWLNGLNDGDLARFLLNQMIVSYPSLFEGNRIYNTNWGVDAIKFSSTSSYSGILKWLAAPHTEDIK